MHNNKPTEGESYGGELTRDTPAHIYEMLRAIGKPVDLLGNPISSDEGLPVKDPKADDETKTE